MVQVRVSELGMPQRTLRVWMRRLHTAASMIQNVYRLKRKVKGVTAPTGCVHHRRIVARFIDLRE